MKRIYDTGLDNNQIHLMVNIATAGIANTVAYLAKSGGQKIKVAESNIDSGDISNTLVDKAVNLRGFYLVIHTIIDFGTIDMNHWELEAKNIRADYQVSGGFSGNQLYNYDNDDIVKSPSGKIITITKPNFYDLIV